MELYKKFRPKNLDEIFGQSEAVKVVRGMIENGKIPHAIMFTGPSGCGKTTIARILRKEMKCRDYQEINAADFGGIDAIRSLRERLNSAPMGGKVKIKVIDEAHGLTNDAQNCLLKVLEDTPDHVYFVLCTTDPSKMLKTVLTRCTEIKMKSVATSDMKELVTSIWKKAKLKLPVSKECTSKIIEASDGSPRKALVLLDQIQHLKKEKDAIEAIQKGSFKSQAIDLARCLINPGNGWAKVAEIIKNLEDDPEGVRRLVLAFMKSVVLNNPKNKRAVLCLSAFRDNFYDCGVAGLVLACHEVLMS